MKCCICNREREPEKVIELTAAEKQLVRRTGQEAPDSYSYCKACWSVLSDRNQGAQLFKGMMQANLSRLGVHNANQIAERYYRFLVDRGAKKPVS